MRWMKLEPIIQSEVSQKEKHQNSISSVQLSHSVVSNSLGPHDSQHTRSPWPSANPRVPSDSCPLSQWCHPAISSSVFPCSPCLQSLPASESFQMSQIFTWGGQSTGVSALASFPPKKSQVWSRLETVRSASFLVLLVRRILLHSPLALPTSPALGHDFSWFCSSLALYPVLDQSMWNAAPTLLN